MKHFASLILLSLILLLGGKEVYGQSGLIQTELALKARLVGEIGLPNLMHANPAAATLDLILRVNAQGKVEVLDCYADQSEEAQAARKRLEGISLDLSPELVGKSFRLQFRSTGANETDFS